MSNIIQAIEIPLTATLDLVTWLDTAETLLLKRGIEATTFRKFFEFNTQDAVVTLHVPAGFADTRLTEIKTVFKNVKRVIEDAVSAAIMLEKDGEADYLDNNLDTFDAMCDLIKCRINEADIAEMTAQEESWDYSSANVEQSDEEEESWDYSENSSANVKEVVDEEEEGSWDYAENYPTNVEESDEESWDDSSTNVEETVEETVEQSVEQDHFVGLSPQSQYADYVFPDKLWNTLGLIAEAIPMDHALFTNAQSSFYGVSNPIYTFMRLPATWDGKNRVVKAPTYIGSFMSRFLEVLVKGIFNYRLYINIQPPLVKNAFARGHYVKIQNVFESAAKEIPMPAGKHYTLDWLMSDDYFAAVKQTALSKDAAVIATVLTDIHKFMTDCGFRVRLIERAMDNCNIPYTPIPEKPVVCAAVVPATVQEDGTIEVELIEESVAYVDGIQVTEEEDKCGIAAYIKHMQKSDYEDAIREMRIANAVEESTSLVDNSAPANVVEESTSPAPANVVEESTSLVDNSAPANAVEESTSPANVGNTLEQLLLQLMAKVDNLTKVVESQAAEIKGLRDEVVTLRGSQNAPRTPSSSRPSGSLPPLPKTAVEARKDVDNETPIVINHTAPVLGKRKTNLVPALATTLTADNGFNPVSDGRSLIIQVTDKEKAATALQALREAVKHDPVQSAILNNLVALLASRNGTLWNRT